MVKWQQVVCTHDSKHSWHHPTLTQRHATNERRQQWIAIKIKYCKDDRSSSTITYSMDGGDQNTSSDDIQRMHTDNISLLTQASMTARCCVSLSRFFCVSINPKTAKITLNTCSWLLPQKKWLGMLRQKNYPTTSLPAASNSITWQLTDSVSRKWKQQA